MVSRMAGKRNKKGPTLWQSGHCRTTGDMYTRAQPQCTARIVSRPPLHRSDTSDVGSDWSKFYGAGAAVISTWDRTWQTCDMKPSRSLYYGHRYPREIISHTVWLDYRFGISLRDVEDLLAERGVVVS